MEIRRVEKFDTYWTREVSLERSPEIRAFKLEGNEVGEHIALIKSWEVLSDGTLIYKVEITPKMYVQPRTLEYVNSIRHRWFKEADIFVIVEEGEEDEPSTDMSQSSDPFE